MRDDNTGQLPPAPPGPPMAGPPRPSQGVFAPPGNDRALTSGTGGLY